MVGARPTNAAKNDLATLSHGGRADRPLHVSSSESVPDAVDARYRRVVRPLLRFGKRGLTIDHPAIRNPPSGVVDVEQATFVAEAGDDEKGCGIEVVALECWLGRICKAHQHERTAELGAEREQRDEAKAYD